MPVPPPPRVELPPAGKHVVAASSSEHVSRVHGRWVLHPIDGYGNTDAADRVIKLEDMRDVFFVRSCSRRGLTPPAATTRHVWFFDILFMSKHMELLSQLKIYDFKLTKIQTSKNQRHKLII